MTATEMAKELNLPLATVKQRLRRTGCKPFCQEALYTNDDFEKIKIASMGRPPIESQANIKTHKKEIPKVKQVKAPDKRKQQ